MFFNVTDNIQQSYEFKNQIDVHARFNLCSLNIVQVCVENVSEEMFGNLNGFVIKSLKPPIYSCVQNMHRFYCRMVDSIIV